MRNHLHPCMTATDQQLTLYSMMRELTFNHVLTLIIMVMGIFAVAPPQSGYLSTEIWIKLEFGSVGF